jgi:hypothetical protein
MQDQVTVREMLLRLGRFRGCPAAGPAEWMPAPIAAQTRQTTVSGVYDRQRDNGNSGWRERHSEEVSFCLFSFSRCQNKIRFLTKNVLRCSQIPFINAYLVKRSFVCASDEQVHSVSRDTGDGGEGHQPPHQWRPPGIVVLSFEVDDGRDQDDLTGSDKEGELLHVSHLIHLYGEDIGIECRVQSALCQVGTYK